MPSKGLSVYSYVSPKLPEREYKVEFSVPGPNGVIVNDAKDNFTVKSLELESKHIKGATNFTGKFQWRVLRNGEEVTSAFAMINTLTGNLEGKEGMLATEHLAPHVLDDVIVTYGFVRSGGDQLVSRDQLTEYSMTLVMEKLA